MNAPTMILDLIEQTKLTDSELTGAIVRQTILELIRRELLTGDTPLNKARMLLIYCRLGKKGYVSNEVAFHIFQDKRRVEAARVWFAPFVRNTP